MAEPIDKLIAEVNFDLYQEFKTKVYSVSGRTIREVTESMMRDFLMQQEGNPSRFPKKRIPIVHHTKKTHRRARVEQ